MTLHWNQALTVPALWALREVLPLLLGHSIPLLGKVRKLMDLVTLISNLTKVAPWIVTEGIKAVLMTLYILEGDLVDAKNDLIEAIDASPMDAALKDFLKGPEIIDAVVTALMKLAQRKAALAVAPAPVDPSTDPAMAATP